jgi:hypothetical protein
MHGYITWLLIGLIAVPLGVYATMFIALLTGYVQ